MQDKIGVFVNDSDHSASYELEEYKTVLPLLHPDSVILGDNAHRDILALRVLQGEQPRLPFLEGGTCQSLVSRRRNRIQFSSPGVTGKFGVIGASRWPDESVVRTPW